VPKYLIRKDLISLDLDSDMLLNQLEGEGTDKVNAFYFGLTHMVRLLSSFFPLMYKWNTTGTPLEYHWNTSGTPSGNHWYTKWNTSGMPVEY